MKPVIQPLQQTLPSVFGTSHWRVALGWWVIAGLLGVGLRYMLAWPTAELNYAYWLHAHSHVVLLGWTFNALFLAVVASFVPQPQQSRYKWSWLGFQLSLLGMLVFFPIQGYAAGSIVFSTLHVFISYYVAWRLWTDLREGNRLSISLLRWGLLFLVLSTAGPYALGILKARHMQETIWYNLAIYYYLHFLYNGWFVFGCLALLFRWLEDRGLTPSTSAGRRFLAAMVVSAAGTVTLSALWTQPAGWVWLVGGAAAVGQLIAGGWLIHWLWQHRDKLRRELSASAYLVARLAFACFGIKLLLQALSAMPWAAEWTYGQRHLVIAYLHLVFIGFISFFLLAWAVQHQLL
ncbi:hypothetical protein [Spirosoma gilvum]